MEKGESPKAACLGGKEEGRGVAKGEKREKSKPPDLLQIFSLYRAIRRKKKRRKGRGERGRALIFFLNLSDAGMEKGKKGGSTLFRNLIFHRRGGEKKEKKRSVHFPHFPSPAGGGLEKKKTKKKHLNCGSRESDSLQYDRVEMKKGGQRCGAISIEMKEKRKTEEGGNGANLAFVSRGSEGKKEKSVSEEGALVSLSRDRRSAERKRGAILPGFSRKKSGMSPGGRDEGGEVGTTKRVLILNYSHSKKRKKKYLGKKS